MSSWRGRNRFRLMPGDAFDERPCAADLRSEVGGQALLLTYTWEHADDGPQDGVLLVGSAGDGAAVRAAWGDSWHQHPGLMLLVGTATGGHVELAAEYAGGGWGWEITVGMGDELTMTMSNVIPAEHATDDAAAGPYRVMEATLQRESG